MENIVSKKKRVFLLFLLFILNIIIRIPSIPHEKGIDSFFIHLLANSLSLYGESRWWINIYSIFGFFPFSYPSATPFSLSGIEQVANVNMESSILLYCILLGLFSMFSMYEFAGALYNNFLFKYMASMLFSLSQGVLLYTTWEVSQRGVFLVFFPIFIYLILKDKISNVKKCFLLLPLLIFLYATHHLAFLTILPIIAYLCLHLIKALNIKKLNEQGVYIYVIMLIIALITPFFTGLFFEGESRYNWVVDAFIELARWIGPLIFIAFGGIMSTLINKDKNLKDWYILILLLVSTPLIYLQKYGKFLLIPLAIIFIAIAFMNIIRLDIKNKNRLKIFMILILLLTFSYSSFFNHARTSSSSSYWYMSEETFCGGSWAKDYVPEGSRAVGPSADNTPASLNSKRLCSIARGHFIIPIQGAADLAHGLVSISGISYVQNSVLSTNFYFDGPFTSRDEYSLPGKVNWMLGRENIDDPKIKSIIHNMSVNYIFEDTYKAYNIMPSVYNTKNRIYDSGNLRIHKV